MQRKEDVVRDWHLVDLEGKVLGRVATEIAKLLMGKDKPTFTPHVDGGDYVVAINASKVELTRNKKESKVYRWHTGFPGGLKEMTFERMMKKHPEKVIERAVYNMLPKNRLRKNRMVRLKIFALDQHPYQNQLKKTE
ncbi:MAG TPA: 50S ribosomal protein L13 [Bacteroidetes bacterium]|nr:50S ribosomal protein L13 [Bacteroidota bacterium]